MTEAKPAFALFGVSEEQVESLTTVRRAAWNQTMS